MTASPESAAAAGDHDTLEVLARDYWDAYLEAHPTESTVLGDHRFDDRLADPTPEGAAATRSRLHALRDRVRALDGAVLGDRDGVTLSALREALDADIAELDTGIADWTLDPLGGVPTGLLNIPAFQRLAAPRDGRRMVERWRAMATYTDRCITTLRRSLADGRVACRAPAERTMALLESLLAQDTATWSLMQPLSRRDVLDAWPTADRERFAASLWAAVTGEVRPAFARLRDVLADEILPATRPEDLPGLCHVPGGTEAYPHLLRAHTSLPLEAEAVHRIGLAEIERIDAELADLAGRTIATRGLADAIVRLRDDPALHFASRDEVFATAETTLRRAEAAVPAWFGRVPVTPCEVVRMPAHEEEHSTIAYYRQPATDGSRPGQYYVNTARPETRPRYEAEALAVHEAVPGHHLQIAVGQELVHLPEFRRHLGPTAFFEGWGLYTERLADEMGLYTGDLDRIGVLSFDAWRAARLVVDTGMHALGWTRGQAIEFMLQHTALAPNNVANEVDRYIVWPGQAVAYKIGQLEILRLRAEAQAALGAAFDIRSFHDALLGSGALALPTLRGVVGAWLGRPPVAQ